MERIDAEVDRELERFGAPAVMVSVLRVWPVAVGETIARNAWPSRLARDGTLHVATSSSTWAFELSQLGPSILERLGEAMGEDAPEALRFGPGRVPEPARDQTADHAAQVLEPTAEARAEADRLAAAIDDPGLRERVARAAALSLSGAPSGRSIW